ncbi:MAG: FAD:protein FMN transferase, partial [Phycisphaerales bacterium]|nr:FAD:protein FMN transferase [Phycisphaerales bacterium]
HASGGAFDPTCGPVVRLWRAARKDHHRPDPDLLSDAQGRTGWTKVRLQGAHATLEPGMRLDFGGIGKGYAADQALTLLRERGFPSALVDIGGDMAIGDPPPGRDAWKIEVELRGTTRPLLQVANVGVATSGDLYQFVEIEGVRYSHIVDARTGEALHTPTVACVVAPDATGADALASAASVLGPDVESILVAEGACALIERETADGLRRWELGAWARIVSTPE